MGKREFLKRILLYGLYVVASCVLIYPVIKFISFRKPQKTRIIFYADEQGAAVTFKEGVFLFKMIRDSIAIPVPDYIRSGRPAGGDLPRRQRFVVDPELVE